MKLEEIKIGAKVLSHWKHPWTGTRALGTIQELPDEFGMFLIYYDRTGNTMKVDPQNFELHP